MIPLQILSIFMLIFISKSKENVNILAQRANCWEEKKR